MSDERKAGNGERDDDQVRQALKLMGEDILSQLPPDERLNRALDRAKAGTEQSD